MKTFRIKNFPSAIINIVCDDDQVAKLADMLEGARQTKEYKVINTNGGVLKETDFGFGKYNKWVTEFEEEKEINKDSRHNLSIEDAVKIILDLAQKNMLDVDDIDKEIDPILHEEALIQEEAYTILIIYLEEQLSTILR